MILNIFFSTNVINNLRKDSMFFYYFDIRDKAKADYHGIVSSLLCQVAAEAIKKNSKDTYHKIYQLIAKGRSEKKNNMKTLGSRDSRVTFITRLKK